MSSLKISEVGSPLALIVVCRFRWKPVLFAGPGPTKTPLMVVVKVVGNELA